MTQPHYFGKLFSIEMSRIREQSPERHVPPAVVKKPAWIKVKNPTYSQKEGRQELFER